MKAEAEAGSRSGGSGPFSAEAEARKFHSLPLPHGREEWKEKRNWFCYFSEKSK